MPSGNRDRLSFRIEFSIKCPRCDRAVPLDGPMETVICGSCKSKIPLTREYWVENISEGCTKMEEVEVGQGTSSMLLGTFNANLSLARFNPYCDECKTEFDYSWENCVGSHYTCNSCGLKYPVDLPPLWLQKNIPQIKFLVNALTDFMPPAKPNSSKPVVLSCPSCSAALEVNGSKRFVDCNYCNSQVYLPDALWMKFHTAKRKRRWFVVCG